MLDFHSHLIPGVDDGSRNVAMSVAMLDMWREQGFDYICATPHFYADVNTPSRFLEKRFLAYGELMDELNKAPGGAKAYPGIFLGAEVHYFRGLSSCEDINKLCLQGTNLLLVEMPFHSWSDYMIREINELSSLGIVPVAAHIERYLSIQTESKLNDLLDTGILIQCNAEFFLTFGTRRKALRMLKEGRIQFLGSDAHNLTSRAPNLGDAIKLIEKKLGSDALSDIRDNEDNIIEARRIYFERGGVA
ncbi:MAG: capsular polysaccharide biosynthesis protein [Clostridiales bacterium]|nr:capsular polysaccharide biosynthesis protein [Clostridiales bacterium]